MEVQKCRCPTLSVPQESFLCSFDPQTVAQPTGLLCLNRSGNFDPSQLTQVSSCSPSNNGHNPSKSLSESYSKPSKMVFNFVIAAQCRKDIEVCPNGTHHYWKTWICVLMRQCYSWSLVWFGHKKDLDRFLREILVGLKMIVGGPYYGVYNTPNEFFLRS